LGRDLPTGGRCGKAQAVSLIDALLLEPSPLDVWIAVRTDGLKGSGTQSDPYDGSTKCYPAVTISSLAKGVTDKTLAAATASNHGFASGDWVTISGVDLGGSNPSDVYYTGTFAITVVDAGTFQYRMLFEPTSSSAPGSAITCCRERERFDTVMRSVPANMAVHLGPGVFETKGLAYSVRTWEPKPGQKLIGSGIGVTTLKLVGAAAPETHYWAVGIHYFTWLHDFEVSDLTIDCNVAGQPNRYVSCGAVNLHGGHIRIRRIRAINFGSHSLGYVENFVITSGATHTLLDQQGQEGVDCVIEDCIAERPSPNPVNNSGIIGLGGAEDSAGVQAYHRGCAIRNCLVNGQIIYGTSIPLPINTISYDASAGVVTVTTKAPHLLTKPGNVVVRGVTVGGNPNNLFNGVFAVGSIESATTFKYSLVTTGTPVASNGLVGGGVSSHLVKIQSITEDDTLEVCPTLALHDFQVYESTYKLTTRDPHLRTTNNNVRVFGVQKLGLAFSSAFNGVFWVADHDPAHPTELLYTLLLEPDADARQLLYGQATINVAHIALGGDIGTAAVVEGNRVFHCWTGGPFHDTWCTKDLVVRNNYYHDVMVGPKQALGGISTTVPIPLASLDKNQDGTKAIAKTSFPHGLVVGDNVTISSTGPDAARYNGTPQITDVPAPNEFWYDLTQGRPDGAAVQPGYCTVEPSPGPGLQPVTSQKRLESLFYIFRDGKKVVSAKTTYAKHGFSVGDAVRVTKAGHFNATEYPNSGVFNGVFEVTAVPNGKTFEYELDPLTPDPGVDSENQDLAVLGVKGIQYRQAGEAGVDSVSEEFAAGYFGRIWQTQSLVIENNIIELGRHPIDQSWSYAVGLRPYGTPFSPQYSIVRLVVRGNVIRNVEDIGGRGTQFRGIELSGCESALIENNIVDLPLPTPLEHRRCGQVDTFNNLTPAGGLLLSDSKDDPERPALEVVTKVRADLEDAMVSAFLKSGLLASEWVMLNSKAVLEALFTG